MVAKVDVSLRETLNKVFDLELIQTEFHVLKLSM